MRAKEFITETTQQKTILNKYVLNTTSKQLPNGSNVIQITVDDPANQKPSRFNLNKAQFNGIGYFNFVKNNDGTVSSLDSQVLPQYQRQGIATEVYKYVKSLGYNIIPSNTRTDQGMSMWKSFTNKGVMEGPLPQDWDPKEIGPDKTFRHRLNYALSRAKRLGGGSSRVAMTIDYQGRPTVLKVAKNKKGLAQNDAEIDILRDGYLGQLPIVIPLIDYDGDHRDPVWIQTELAQKITAPTLKKLLHAPVSWILSDRVRQIIGEPSNKFKTEQDFKDYYFREAERNNLNYTEQDYEIFNEYASEVASLCHGSGLEPGDLTGASNWGIFQGRPVIIDLGLTKDVWDTYYKR